jgi:general secretion pathway protein E
VSDETVELDKVFDFDVKAYDIGIQDKILIASPGLSLPANQFAERQRIKVFEVEKLDSSG